MAIQNMLLGYAKPASFFIIISCKTNLVCFLEKLSIVLVVSAFLHRAIKDFIFCTISEKESLHFLHKKVPKCLLTPFSGG